MSIEAGSSNGPRGPWMKGLRRSEGSDDAEPRSFVGDDAGEDESAQDSEAIEQCYAFAWGFWGIAMNTQWVNIATFAIAVLGAVLGVLNTWSAMTRDRVRLVVKAGWAFPTDGSAEGLYIEIINVGYLPVTVAEIGFSSGSSDRLRSTLVDDYVGRVRLPYRLEPRASMAIFANPRAHQAPSMTPMDRAFVRTACLRWFFGGRKVVSDATAELRGAPQQTKKR